MKNFLITSIIFEKQKGPDDCGTACLAMLLNYAGRSDDAEHLKRSHDSPPGGLSLSDLQKIAAIYDLRSKCVELQIEYLRELKTPCILHVINPGGSFHFLVCYAGRRRYGKWSFLTADPATGPAWINESDLIRIWRSNAALYIENIPFKIPGISTHSWWKLIRSVSGHNMVFLTIPLLNISAGILGIALSWLLQRGLDHPLAELKVSLIAPVIICLGIIMTGRSLSNFLKQAILIRINADIRDKYYKIVMTKPKRTYADETVVRKNLADIQKIQNAAGALFAVLVSESTVVTMLLGGLWYYEPVIGMINTIYVVLMIALGINNSIDQAKKTAELSELQNNNERLHISLAAIGYPEEQLVMQIKRENNLTSRAKSLAKSISLYTFRIESLGSIIVIAILSYCQYSLRQGQISYNILMTEVIISYFLTILVPRICQVFPVITEGARLLGNFQ